jgi:hypothetical protein
MMIIFSGQTDPREDEKGVGIAWGRPLLTLSFESQSFRYQIMITRKKVSFRDLRY